MDSAAAGVGELFACGCQCILDLLRLGMRCAKYALIRYCDRFERRHGLAEIIDCSAIVQDWSHRLIRADSLNNHRWQETEAKFLSAGSSDSLPPQDRWKTSLPPGQNTTAPRPRHI